MPRWAIVLTVAPLVLCLGCVAIGFVVIRRGVEEAVPEVRGSLSAEMTEALSGSVSRRIEARALAAGGIGEVAEVVIRASDMNVNTIEVADEVGFETGPEGAHIYGVEAEIASTGITLLLPGVAYSAVPVVKDGRIELTQIEESGSVLGFIFSDDLFEQVLEDGINGPLRDHGLTPAALSLRPGSMIITVEPLPCHGSADWIGGCPWATPAYATSR